MRTRPVGSAGNQTSPRDVMRECAVVPVGQMMILQLSRLAVTLGRSSGEIAFVDVDVRAAAGLQLFLLEREAYVGHAPPVDGAPADHQHRPAADEDEIARGHAVTNEVMHLWTRACAAPLDAR